MQTIESYINTLNRISALTDSEGKLIEFIQTKCRENGLHTVSCESSRYCVVPPLYIGSGKEKYVFVTHCDRIQNSVGDMVYTGDIVTGKFDNTVSLAIMLKILLENPKAQKDIALLITTAEELKGLGNNHGGRGFLAYLDYIKKQAPLDFIETIKEKYFICVDVRPLDKNRDVKKDNGEEMMLGDGIVVRLKEERTGVKANSFLVETLFSVAKEQAVPLISFTGGGTTEIGRGWEKCLQHEPDMTIQDYCVAWVQPPIKEYHTDHEKMHVKDIERLYQLLRAYCGVLEK